MSYGSSHPLPLFRRRDAAGHRVALIVSDGANPFEMSVATELFGMPRPELDVPWYRFLVCAPEPEVVMRDGLFSLKCPGTMRDVGLADTVIVPNQPDPTNPPDPRVIDAVRRADRRGARLVAFCTGAFTLAAAGVLDGRTVTCHWRWADALRARYPRVIVTEDVLFVEDGRILSSAGSAAALDLGLAIVQRDYGATVAGAVSKRLVFALHRPGGQRQFIERGVRDSTDQGGLTETVEWATANLGEPIDVGLLAERAHMSVSTFHRKFRSTYSTSPLEWLQRERTAAALVLLETDDNSVDRIAQRCGFGTAATLRTYVLRLTGLSPTMYRTMHRHANRDGP